MNKQLNQVKEFMLACGQSVATTPTIPDSNVRQLRFDLLKEELNELKEALDNNDINEVADAIVDSSYVHLGTLLSYGIYFLDMAYFNDTDTDDCVGYLEHLNRVISTSDSPHIWVQGINIAINTLVKLLLPEGKFEALFDEVHRSNMSKFCTNTNDADATQSQYQQNGVLTEIVKRGDLYVILRQEDGKVLKGIHYSKPDLESILNG